MLCYRKCWLKRKGELGGKLLEAALDNMKTFGRIVLCGMISGYNATSPTPGPSILHIATFHFVIVILASHLLGSIITSIGSITVESVVILVSIYHIIN